jgi:RNA polymerase sigma factor (sigma-70 family)
MTTCPMSRFVHRLRATSGGDGRADGELLRAFTANRDAAALAALVRRHGPMVWGVCRRTLRHRPDAEDAFQATFLVLVRKAAGLRDRAAVGNWLYGVAHRTAVRVRAAAAKAHRREQQVATMPDPPAPDRDGDDLRPVIDAELARLPDKYRAVVVLCDLEGLTRADAARELGVPEGTVAGRLARARAMLGKRLVRRGVSACGAAGVAPAAAAGAPPGLVSSTVEIAVEFAAGRAGAVPVAVSALSRQVVFAMTLKKTIPAALVVFAALAGGAGGTAYLAIAAGAGSPAPAGLRPRTLAPKDNAPIKYQKALAAAGRFVAAGGDKDGPRLPDGWKSDAAFAELDAADPHGGKASLKLSATAKAPGYAWASSEQVPVTAGREYLISAWVKSKGNEDGKDFVCIRWFKDGKYLDQFGPPVGKDEKAWAEVTATATAPDGATHMDAAIFVRSKAGTVWVDDVSVTANGEAKNLIPNGGLEAPDK